MGTSPKSLSIVSDYDSLMFIDNLQAYNASVGTDQMLDLMREIQESGNYYWQGNSFPPGGNTTVPGNSTANGSIQVPQGTWITGITHYEDTGGWGFKFKLYDKGSKASIFYGDYAHIRTVSSCMSLHVGVGTSNPPSDPGSNLDNPYGPNYLLEPFIVNTPGVLGWEVVNLSPNPAVIQVLLSCAVPINQRSTGQMIVEKGG